MGFADNVSTESQTETQQEAGAEESETMDQHQGAFGQEETLKEPSKETTPDWRDALGESARAWADQKGFGSMDDVLRGHENLERLKGVPEERLVKLPVDDSAESWNEVFTRLGRPENADGYEVPGENAEFVAKAYHESGLTKRQADMLTEKIASFEDDAAKSRADQISEKIEADYAAMNGEWGGEYDKNLSAAHRAVRSLGLSADDVRVMEESLGVKRTMNMMAQFGKATGEHQFAGESGRSGSVGMTPENATQKIKQLMGDPTFRDQLFSKDKAVRQAAMDRKSELNRIALQ